MLRSNDVKLNNRRRLSKAASLMGEDDAQPHESLTKATLTSDIPPVEYNTEDRRLHVDNNHVKPNQEAESFGITMPANSPEKTNDVNKSRISPAKRDGQGEPHPHRFVTKNGHCRIKRTGTQMGSRYMTDIFTTLIDLQWKYNLIIFVLVYTAGWSLFGFLWWIIAFLRGDVDARVNGNLNHTYCVKEVYSYPTAFLFYVETETSIGYGKRAITEECAEAIILFVTQALMGSIVDAFMVGCIYIKLSQPKSGVQTLVFSKTCALAQRDNKYCLMFRVANLRNSLLIQCRIRAKLVRQKETKEGERIMLHQDDINLGFDTGADNLFLVTPLIICHAIDKRSPFYGFDKADFQKKTFEIIVILEGIVESTGMICQARTSYLNSEIYWGERFMPVLFHARGHFKVDHSAFHTTFEVHMPSYSMSKFEELNAGDAENENTDPATPRLTAAQQTFAVTDTKTSPTVCVDSQDIIAQ